ncbi:MAG: DNA phosphorothioation system sulfurtransferase DndC [Gammaproteobacteria bacterium]|nr:DNA phosphorothioation system sulfurtransferase DndC [Gammaproteobacteria bacterium]
MKKKIKYIIDEIIDQYLYADETSRPWIIGFSGGKDSTVLLQLVWEALTIIKNNIADNLQREVYVVSNDTMIENPIITEYVHRVLHDVEKAALNQGLPFRIQKTTPRLEDSFFVNLIGRGYPAPNSTFRWCTERLKIKPTSRFILEQVNLNGEAIILLGTRSDESSNRAKSIKKHSTRGKRLSKHALHPNILTYMPIKDLMLEEVWFIINTMPSPWGSSNTELFQVYANASADDYECPTTITENKHSSCGQSRFGCWVCTVVPKDKSMTAQVENGVAWLTPLLKFRNAIVEERNLIENRMPTMRNGREAINGMGTYTPEYRAIVLERLLLVQKEIQQEKPHVELISNQELIAIQVIWYRDLIFNHKVSKIYNKFYNKEFDMKNQDEKIRRETEILQNVCKDCPDNFELIQDLLSLQKNKALLTKKRGLKDDIERKIENFINS